MKKRSFLLLITFITLALSGSVQAVGVAEITGFQGKATDWRTPDTVMGNTTQLMTRDAAMQDCKKSWLQFDLTSLYAENATIQGNILNATLTFVGAKAETGAKSYVVNGLNDDAGLENWVASELTWNNAPGNDISHGTALIPSLTTNLYSATIPVPQLDVVSETPEEYQDELTAFLNTDTDGKVTFILTAGSTCYVWNVGVPGEPVLTLTYLLGQNTEKAHNPVPADDAVVGTAPTALSWVNPEPNFPGDPIFCDVYLGTEPNILLMDKVTLADDVSTVAVNTTNFPNFGALTYDTRYYWQVDCHDPGRQTELIPGEMWSFYVGQSPTADAGPDQFVWLDPDTNEVTVNLDGTTSDDGPYAILWTQEENEAPRVIIDPDDVDDISITFTERGDYEFMLTADDGALQTSDTVRVVVGNDACDASHIATGDPYNEADVNEDCTVDLIDLQELIITDWMNCTDVLTNCSS